MSVLGNTPLLMTPEGYQISRSVRLRSSASAYFSRTPASAGNRKTWTWSSWVKRSNIGTTSELLGSNGTTNNTNFAIEFSGDTLYVGLYSVLILQSTAVFRDPSAWYHIVVNLDTTQATASNRCRVYVNGSEITAWSTDNRSSLTQNADYGVNNTDIHNIGRNPVLAARYFDGYLTEVNFIDGQALTPSSFGETDAITGVWKPKKYAGTYGTNGFYLNFSDNSNNTAATIGKDYSGNGNNWTPNNISVTSGVTYDSMLDTPTPYADGGNGRGNYATLNPLMQRWAVGSATISAGNLQTTTTLGSSTFAYSTIGVSSGKWYWEGTMTAAGTNNSSIGIGDLQTQWGTFTNLVEYNKDGTHSGAGGSWATFTTNDVIGMALDCDASSIAFYKNGALQGSVSLNSGVTFFSLFDTVTNGAWAANFGQRPFAYTPPTGFKALNTQNLSDSTIKKGNQYFNATTYTGNGTSLTVTNTGAMQPDFVWIKSRSGTNSHWLVDAVRGVSNGLISNSTGAEQTLGLVTAFNSNGFSVAQVSTNDTTNGNAMSLVGWQWKESAAAGFDIVTYTGDGTSARAISHSLGVAPKMVIVKARSLAGENWNCWHTSLGGNAYRILLNTTGAVDTGSPSIWGTGGINPTSTTFQVGSSSGTNGNTSTYVAYLFAEVAGFSKFGSYTGNGSADGPFIYLGFKARFILMKRTDTSGYSWYIYDTARNTYNALGSELLPNDSAAEVANSADMDITASGWKIRTSGVGRNANGGTYIYAAFAEVPTKYALAR